jgi:peptidyl-prolyl cis-trans isomerase D
MLQAIKDGTRGWVAYVIIGMLAVPFAFFGVYSYFQPSSNPTIAEVNGEQIKRNELDQTVSRQRQQLRRQLGADFDPDQISDERLRDRALEQLINERVWRTFADSHGMVAPDGVVARRIRSDSRFQNNGEFSSERYREVLSRSNISVTEYENRLRRNATVVLLRDAVGSSAFVTEAELDRMAAVQYQRRHLAWLRVSGEALRDQVEVSDDEVANYYEDNKKAFERPQRVRLAYVELSRDTLADGIEVTNEQLRARYDQVKDQRGQPERRRVEQIQLDVPEDADDEQVREAEERLRSIRERIVSGDLGFEKAASEHSEDKLSAKRGGEIGLISPGDLGGAFDDAAFELDKGVISEPVRTSSGVHLIRVTEVKPAQRPSFESIKGELREAIIDERVAKRIADQTTELKNEAFRNSKSLKPAASALGLEVRETDWFSQRGADSGLAANEAIVTAAFSQRVLEERRNSELIELSDNRRVVVRVADHEAAQVPPLEEVREQVVERVRSQELTELTRKRGQALIKRVQEGGERFGSLAQGDAISLNEYGWISRQSRGEVPRSILATAFRMPAPGDGDPSLEGTPLPPKGPGQAADYAVIALRGVQDGSLDGLSDQQRQRLRQQLQRVSQQSSLNEVTAALREQADVTIYEGRL